MCGIVGYVGNEKVVPVLLNGLSKLEYRGYDSAGIATFNQEFNVSKSVGKIANLKSIVDVNYDATIGIGHTRWATHGKPTHENSHPHISNDKSVLVVHNGVIDNYLELKEEYLQGYEFYSQTDTEVVANLIQYFYKQVNNVDEALQLLISKLEGSYALVVLFLQENSSIYALKNKSPMLIGVGNDFNIIASDALAFTQYTNRILEIGDKEYIKLNSSSVEIKNFDGTLVSRDEITLDLDDSTADKGMFEHFMLKEIYDQPTVIRKLINAYSVDNVYSLDEKIVNLIQDASSIHIIAAGTSYYSGLVSQSLLEKKLQKSVQVHIASEFVYDTPFLSGNPLFIFVSQSGETADSRAALVLIKEKGYHSLTITNVSGSTLSREADAYLLLHAGREIAVASTKAFVAQLTLFSIIGEVINPSNKLTQDLNEVSLAIEEVFESRSLISQLSKDYFVDAKHAFYIGRGVDSKLALEGALKLKEISYIHTEGMSSGELKHGSIALIENNTPVLALISQDKIASNTRSNIEEVKARGANVCTVVRKSLSNEQDTIVYADVNEDLAAIVAVVVLQLISYYTALYLECDIDMPRNLAKSVTVE